VESVATHNSRQQANHSSQLQTQEVKKPPNTLRHLIFLLILILLVLLLLFAAGRIKM
jgi:hypothetical protein